jgi:hypothetical protein
MIGGSGTGIELNLWDVVQALLAGEVAQRNPMMTEELRRLRFREESCCASDREAV